MKPIHGTLVGCLILTVLLAFTLPVFPSSAIANSGIPDPAEGFKMDPGPLEHEPGTPLPEITTGMLVVGGITVLALIFFALELVPMDITALGIMISLILLEPWTGVSAIQGISGFSSTATITVLAMFVIGEGIRRTGLITALGNTLVKYVGNGLKKQLGAIVGIVTPSSGILNNTAVVAILLPMVTRMANKCKRSPSKLLIPLSYASMFGGMLTLVGTSTNLLASDLSARLLDHPLGMFEFTKLGIAISIGGMIYLVFVAPFLLKSRIKPKSSLTDQYKMKDYLAKVSVKPDSLLVNKTVGDSFQQTPYDADIIQLIREDTAHTHTTEDQVIKAGDQLVIRSDRNTLLKLMRLDGLTSVARESISDEDFDDARVSTQLVEVIVAPGSSLIGESLSSTSFRSEYDATVLAIRHGETIQQTRMDEQEFQIGDTLLVQANSESLGRLRNHSDFIVAQEIDQPDERRDKIPYALGITGLVIGTAALGLLDVVTAALSGALMMVLTGCLRPHEFYEAVRWDIIFLLASLIPLGIAMEYCGAADLLAGLIAKSAGVLPAVGVLGLIYAITVVLTNLISNNASVLLMIPIAVDTALRINADPFSFLLAVTFAASTAFMTPMGYQTNLFVHGPGGYKFRDFLIVGTPLQVITGLVTTFGIAYWWPL